MSKFFTIAVLTLLALWSGLLSAPAALAADLVVEFENSPLFNEANFAPGQSVTRWVKVTNNTSQTQQIATQGINNNDPGHLGPHLDLEIYEGADRVYNGNFANFFADGEDFLSDLSAGAQTQYDFIVTFRPGTNDPFQGKSMTFDIAVGFQGGKKQASGVNGGDGGGHFIFGINLPSSFQLPAGGALPNSGGVTPVSGVTPPSNPLTGQGGGPSSEPVTGGNESSRGGGGGALPSSPATGETQPSINGGTPESLEGGTEVTPSDSPPNLLSATAGAVIPAPEGWLGLLGLILAGLLIGWLAHRRG